MTSLPARTTRRDPSASITSTPMARPLGHHDPGHVHIGLELEGGQLPVVEVAARGAVAQAGVRALLEQAHPLLRLGVVVGEDLHAERVGRGVDELERRLDRAGVPGDLDRAADTAEVVGAVLEVLDPAVDLVDLVGRPAVVALGGPGVVVGPVAAHPQQPVDRAGAADDLAAGLRDLAVQGVGLRGGVVAPVDGLLDLRDRVHRPDHAGLLDQEPVVAAARLEQDHAGAGLGQPSGAGTPGAARPHHDVVGLVGPRRWPRACPVRHASTSARVDGRGRATPPATEL